jgi:RNA polymerase sigma-70 factor (ECF subfamily)
MVREATDEELMSAVADGDPEAFGELVLRRRGFVWAVAFRFTGDPVEAEDIVQETFLKVWEAGPRYRAIARFSTYLHRIATRICIDRGRKKRPVSLRELPDPVDRSPGPAERLERKEADLRVRRALDALPPRQRIAVILKYYEDLSYADIADAMDVSHKAVERLLARAGKALRSRLFLEKWE